METAGVGRNAEGISVAETQTRMRATIRARPGLVLRMSGHRTGAAGLAASLEGANQPWLACFGALCHAPREVQRGAQCRIHVQERSEEHEARCAEGREKVGRGGLRSFTTGLSQSPARLRSGLNTETLQFRWRTRHDLLEPL